MNTEATSMPPEVAAIHDAGYALWAGTPLSAEFRSRFAAERIPVAGIRHVRVWGIQVDDERELPGHERTSIPDEDLWEVRLEARDGQIYEVSAALVTAAP